MIVYNVKRRFYAQKADAESYRKAEGLKPAATTKLEIKSREDLAALLTALCEPPAAGEPSPPPGIIPSTVIDNAFVPADFKVPDFIRKSHEQWLKRYNDVMGGGNG